MKHLLTVLCFVLTLAVYASERLSVADLPMPLRPLAEVETNVVFNAGAASDNLWRLLIELDATASNCVEVVFGADADGDGKLGVKEGELCVGWDCGEWFWRDRRGGATQGVACEGGTRRLDWLLRLDRDGNARSVSGNVFSGALPGTCFSREWNMVRVVSRGAETVNVESRMSVDAFKLRIR